MTVLEYSPRGDRNSHYSNAACPDDATTGSLAAVEKLAPFSKSRSLDAILKAPPVQKEKESVKLRANQFAWRTSPETHDTHGGDQARNFNSSTRGSDWFAD
jgi:hypothetical protein